MHFRTLQFLAGIILTFTCATSVLAQSTNGSIRGTVTDQNGAVLPRATVVVKHVETATERRVVLNEDGGYVADNLQPGEYEVRVEARGFQRQIQRATVLTGGSVEVDVSMTVGASTETVVITSDAARVNTSDYKVDGVITRERIENLPLNGRSFLSLASLEPGVEVTFDPNPGANNYFRVSIAGAAQSLTRISVDGANVNDRITGGASQNFSQETVQEFQIATFNFDLSVGNTAFGAVNIVSRTGGNQFHGSGFYFFRDHNMAAYPAFKRPCDPTAFNPGCNDAQLRPRLEDPFFVRRNTGVNLSGPVRRDRLFFFANYEFTNQVGARTISFANPLFAGFSHVGQLPFRGKLFNARLDFKPGSKHNGYLRYSQDVNTNLSGGGNLESTWTSSRNYAYQGNLGVTSILRPTLVNEFRYSYSFYSNQLRPPNESECANPLYCFNLNGPRIGGFGLTIGNDNNVTQHRILRTYQLNENVYWQKGSHRVRFGGNWEHFYGRGSWARIFQGTFNLYSPETLQTQSPALYAALPASLRGTTAGLPTLPTLEDILMLPVNGNISVSVGDPRQPPAYNAHDQARNDAYRLYFQDTWQIRPRFSFSYGLAWSFDDNLISHDLDKPEYLRPVLGGSNAILTPTRQDYNNFQPSIGFAWTIDRQNKTVIRAGTGIYHSSPNSFYTRLGERGFIGPAGNGLVPLDSSLVPNPTAGQTIPGSNILAQPAVLRFTQPTTFNGQNAVTLIPSIRSLLASRWGTGQDLSIRGIEVTKQAVGAAGEGIFMSDLATGYTYQVTFGVQREVARNMILTADFAMRRAVKFGGTEAGFGVDINRFQRPKVTAVDPATQFTTFTQDPIIPVCTAAQSAIPKFPCSSGIILGYWSGISTRYTGLLVKLDKRFANGWQFTGSYALSRNVSNVNAVANQVSLANLYETAGVSGGDRTHRFTFSGFYELPEYKGDNRLLRGLVNSWQVGLISDMRSPLPLNPTLSLDVDGDGVSRLTLPGIPWNGFGRGSSADHIRSAVERYNADVKSRAKPVPANATAVQIAQCTLFIDGQRMCGARTPQNQVMPLVLLPEGFSNGDPFYSHDLRLTRFIRIREKVRLSLIAESFNLFNIANLTGYGSGLNALATPGQIQQATFGLPSDRVNQIFGTGGPRAFQLAARVSF